MRDSIHCIHLAHELILKTLGICLIQKQAGCNNDINHLVGELSISKFDNMFQWGFSIIRHDRCEIWKTFVVAIGLKWMGHVECELYGKKGTFLKGTIVIIWTLSYKTRKKTSWAMVYPWLPKLKWVAGFWNLPFLWPREYSNDSAKKTVPNVRFVSNDSSPILLDIILLVIHWWLRGHRLF